MSLTDPIKCEIEKFYEGDVQPGRPISECVLKKMGANLNGMAQAWKVECKDFTGSGTWTSPEYIFGAFAIAHNVAPSFLLNQFAGEIVSLSGQSGLTYIDNIEPNTNYNDSTSGTITLICISC